jgi:methyl-accepting chemotaxis protein
MTWLVKFFKNPFYAQLFTVILLLCLMVVSIFLFFEIKQNRQELLHALEERSLENAGLLQLMVNEPLFRGDDGETSKVFARLADKFPKFSFSIAGIDGLVTYSTSQKKIKEPFSRAFSHELVEVYKKGFAPHAGDNKIIRLVEEDGRRKVMLVTTIENKPECYHCHGWSNTELGATAVLADVEDELESFFWDSLSTLGFGQFSAVLLALLLGFFLSRRLDGRLKSDEELSRISAEKRVILDLVMEAGSIVKEYAAVSATLIGQLGHAGVQAQKGRDCALAESKWLSEFMLSFEALKQSAATIVQSSEQCCAGVEGEANTDDMLTDQVQQCAQTLLDMEKQAEELTSQIADASRGLQIVQDVANRLNMLALTTVVDATNNEQGGLLKVTQVLQGLTDEVHKYAADMHDNFGLLDAKGREIAPFMENIRQRLDLIADLHIENQENKKIGQAQNKNVLGQTVALRRSLTDNKQELQKIIDRLAQDSALFLQACRTIMVAEEAVRRLVDISERLKKVLETLAAFIHDSAPQPMQEAQKV